MSLKEERVEPIVDGTQGPSSEQSEEWLDRRDHPLLNHVILGTLVKCVRRYDLKECRVVCKNWNLRTIPEMSSTFKVTIHGSNSNEQNDNVGDQDTRRIDHFVELFSSNILGIPITKFKLGPFCTTDGVGKEFLEICGETATEIDLFGNGRDSEVYMIEDVSELLKSCPKIQDLVVPFKLISRSGSVVKLFPDSIPTFHSLKKIRFRRDDKRERLEFCPTLIEELLAATSKISNLFVSNEVATVTGGNGIEITAVLSVIEKLGLESSIQSLDLDWVKIGDMARLVRMSLKEEGLKLKCLSIMRAGLRRVDSFILPICFTDTLQYFSMEIGGETQLTEFPYMPQLKTLKFSPSMNVWERDDESLDLNEYFPILESFKFNPDNCSESSRGFFNLKPCSTVKSLHVYNVYKTILPFLHIPRVFPNLIKLELNLSVDGTGPEIMRRIWGRMTGLESLSIYGQIEGTDVINVMELDSIFTGIPTQTLNIIRRVVNELVELTVDERREWIEDLRLRIPFIPLSIRNLTKLRHLHLHLSLTGIIRDGPFEFHRRRSGVYHLTDLTACFALSSMTHLRHLNVMDCMFTQTACEMLVKEIGLESWKFMDGDGTKDIIPPFVPHA